MVGEAFNFHFKVDVDGRSTFLKEAQRTLGAYREDLSGTTSPARSPRDQAAFTLLQDLDRELAEFSGYPDIIPLEEHHFAEHGLKVPARFADLRKRHRFYWIRFPTVLKPAPGTIFSKLECGVHFSPSTTEGHLMPRASLILPDRKFQEVLGGHMGLELHIDENFEFAVASGKLEQQLGPAAAKMEAAADVKAAARLGVVAGPFKYSWKRALVDHTAPGAEKVFWTLSDASFTQSDELAFVVVLQVPLEVTAVDIVGALRAYHRFNPAADLGEVFEYFGQRLKEFFKAGAPTATAPKVWNITPSL